MADRLHLHEKLCEILENDNAYFNAPSSVIMKYPCIRYKLSPPDIKRANNRVYMYTNRYELTVIDHNPASEIPRKILEHFQYAQIDRTYTADNLSHTTITIYY